MSIIPTLVNAPPDGVRELLKITVWNAESQKLLDASSPMTYLQKGMPPFLFIHGTADALVPFTFRP